MDMDNRSGKMDQNMMGNGRETKQTVKVLLSMPMVTSTKGSGLMIKLMDMEPTSMQMEPHTSESGSRINNTELVLKNGPTVPSTKVNTRTVRNMETVA